jgi:hypothetical protein
MPVSGTFKRNRTWLNGLMLVLSVIVWLAVSSNRNSVLHAIGKLGLTTKGYGTVNLPLLIVALAGSIGAFSIASKTFAIDVKRKQLFRLVLGIVILSAATALIGMLFDDWFSVSLFLALAVELSELIVAGLIGWIVLFRPSNETGWLGIVGSFLFGLFGLIFVTSIGLLICPRVSFRF